MTDKDVPVPQPQPDITCRELVELVTDYLEGALDPVDRRRFEAHIAGCDGCTAYVDQMRQTIAAFGRLDEQSLDPAAREKLLDVFRSWRRDRVSADG